MGHHVFSCRSLLLSTTVLNDIAIVSLYSCDVVNIVINCSFYSILIV